MSGKDTYLPFSLYKKGYRHLLTVDEVMTICGVENIKELKKFQEKNHLGADGKIGTKTYKYVVDILEGNNEISFISGGTRYIPDYYHGKGYRYRIKLNDVKYVIGGSNISELKNFQRIHNLGSDGIIGRKTYKYVVHKLIKDGKIRK